MQKFVSSKIKIGDASVPPIFVFEDIMKKSYILKRRAMQFV